MKPTKPVDYGFKRITMANWNETDDIIQFPSPVRDETWVKACLKPETNSAVPKKITAMFEVARGSMIYGWFFYPLITLAAEQCHRVLEAGARTRCEQLGLPTKIPKKKGGLRDAIFSELIKSLAKHGAIFQRDLPRWGATRHLRNSASHPSRQTILSPGMAISCLESSVELLNQLFK